MSQFDDKQAEACGEGCDCSGPVLPRRQFLKVTGVGMLATSFGLGYKTIMAGPFDAGDTMAGHLVPADKKLNPQWVQSLYERGIKEVFKGADLETIGMPCGGIGSGQMYLTGDGRLGCWMIFNDAQSRWVPGKATTFEKREPARPFDQGFALVVGDDEKVLPLDRETFPEVSFKGEYPIATIDYKRDDVPVEVTLESYSPYIPLEMYESALPLTVFNYTVRNTGNSKVKVSLAGWLENAVGHKSSLFHPGLRQTRIWDRDGLRMLQHCTIDDPNAKDSEINAPKVFEDFESGDWNGWTPEGDAFGERPQDMEVPHQQKVVGREGRAFVNTFMPDAHDAPTGTLTSPEFTIERQYINFKMGGGHKQQICCMDLVVDGQVVRTQTGHNTEGLTWFSWVVTDLIGQQAQLIIRDEESGGWGHIMVDQIEFADEARIPVPERLDLMPDYGTFAIACDQAGEFGSIELPLRHAGAAGFTQAGEHNYPITDNGYGLMRSRSVELAPGEETSVSFAISWRFPNGPHGHHHAERFADAASVIEYYYTQRERLESATRLWRDSLYDSTLPYWLLDRLHSTMSYLATGTCWIWANGRFWAFEGTTCCHGTCTHVWNYAHGHARLFPDLGRNIRERQDLMPKSQDPDGGFHDETGLVGFRHDHNYAADGQCGTVLKAYREHMMSPDMSFLESNWEKIKKVLDFSISHDENNDGLIEDLQHNTFDINYFGANTFVGSLYLAALRAAEEMALEMGDTSYAEKVRPIFESGRKLSMERLWNGEYFEQEVDLEEHTKNQYKTGCLSDQLFGQSWAHQLNLGYIYPQDAVRTTMQSIFKYNWAPDVTSYSDEHPPFRWFLNPGQAGLFTCTWPKGDYLPEGTMYKNEVWSGIEYQVATGLIAEGFVEEGLTICRAIHDRYHPQFFNPYNEVECGDHYARAIASWGVYLALAGFDYHGPKGRVGFAPRINADDFKAAFTYAEGWACFTQQRKGDKQAETLEMLRGRLRVKTLHFEVAEGTAARAKVRHDGETLHAEVKSDGNRLTIELDQFCILSEGQRLEIAIG